jgi:tetratricopeptide (TPR) repeat protein
VTACDFCGARSSLRDLFVSWPTGLGRPGLICPRCRALSQPSPKLAYWPLLVALLVAGLGFADGGALLAARWLVGLFLVPAGLTAAHELAHALAGKLTGARVFEVRFGWKRPRFQARILRLRVTIARGLLRGGYCVAAYLKPRAARWRYAVFYGTPMALHATAAAAAWLYLPLPRSLGAIGIGHFFLFHNLLFLLASARPFDYEVGAFSIPSDGKALLLLLTQRAQVEAWRRTGFVVPAIYALLDGEREESVARAREAEHLFPDDPDVQRALFTVYWALGYYAYALRLLPAYAQSVRQPEQLDERQLLALGAMQGPRLERWLRCVVYLHGEAWDAALKEIEAALAEERLEEAKAMWLALRADLRLIRGAEGDAEAALPDATAAFERLPWVSFICGVAAAAILEAGRREDALRMLGHADRLDREGQELPVRNLWRAVAQARLGRVGQARRSLREALARGLEVGPPPALVRRVQAALSDG